MSQLFDVLGDFSANPVLPNNNYYQIRDSGGTARDILGVNASDNMILRNSDEEAILTHVDSTGETHLFGISGSSGEVKLYPAGNTSLGWCVQATNSFFQAIAATGGFIGQTGNTGTMTLNGGSGNISAGTGSYVFTSGVSSGSGGLVEIAGASAAGGHIRLRMENTSAELRIQQGGTVKMAYTGTERILNYTNTMGDGTEDPTTDAPDDWIEVQISGATRYIPVYT